MRSLGCRALGGRREYAALAKPCRVWSGSIAAVIEEARKRHILLPTPRTIDFLCQQARVRSERLLHQALTTGLSEATRKCLDGFLEIAPETTTTRLSWLRNASQSPAPTNTLGLIERVAFPRKLGLDRGDPSRQPRSIASRVMR